MGKYQDQLTADKKTAMKAGEKFRLGVIWLLIADIKDRQMRSNQDTLDEEEELAVLRMAVKTRRDSVARAEKAEIEIVQGYLLASLSGEALLAKHKGLAEGGDVNAALRSLA